MTTETAAIKLTHSANGFMVKKAIQDRVITALLSIATTGIISCCAFLWKTNSTLSAMQQHDVDADKRMDNIEGKINNIQLDIREERAVRIELLKTRK